jgi:hypothetical protein
MQPETRGHGVGMTDEKNQDADNDKDNHDDDQQQQQRLEDADDDKPENYNQHRPSKGLTVLLDVLHLEVL